MYFKTVEFEYEGQTIKVTISCVPSTPDSELIRRARNIILKHFDNTINIKVY